MASMEEKRAFRDGLCQGYEKALNDVLEKVKAHGELNLSTSIHRILDECFAHKDNSLDDWRQDLNRPDLPPSNPPPSKL